MSNATPAPVEPGGVPAVLAPPAVDVWGWLSTAQKNVQHFAEVASKVAHEKATILAKQAEEMRKNYDMEVATSILMSTVSGPIDGTPAPARETKQVLRDLDLTYITENIISMSFPCDFSKTSGDRVGNDINLVAALMRKRHAGHFMIWNISEEAYDYGKFSDQVLEYKFPGHPAPPLGLLFKICSSVESWLDADARNIAVIHCLTGKGRTAALMACVLTWIGEFSSPMEALQYISERRKISVDNLTIPSQRRYIQYFSNMLDGVKPRSEPLMLRRVIINNIPVFGTDAEEGEGGFEGCCPYVQLFKNGKLIATAAAQGDRSAKDKMQLRWVKASDGSASFNIECAVQGDLLLRCRHVARSGVRVSMFRCGFHTGYVPSGVLRLTKAQLDGASSDSRFDEDFFVDLIFSPIEVNSISAETINASPTVPGADDTPSQPEATSSSTDKFELTLHRDAKFWDSVASRKQKAKRRKSRKFVSSQQEQFSIDGGDVKAETEVDFYATFAGAEGKASSLSDMDLIQQLAELEGDGKKSEGEEGEGLESSHGSLSMSAPASTSASTSELQALEDLEKELGLDSFALFGGVGTGAGVSGDDKVDKTPGPEDDNDDLDELEQYLQSLGPPK